MLILDEPTSTLTPQEAEGLFDALRAMAAEGMGVIFISHKLNEVRAITNHLMILRQGKVTATLDNDANISRRRLAELMCDCDIDPPAKPPAGAREGAAGTRGHPHRRRLAAAARGRVAGGACR